MRERITGRTTDGMAYVRSETGAEGVGAFTTQRRTPEMIARLAEYEDEQECREKGCSWCEKPIYIEAVVYQKSLLAPLTPEGELAERLTDLTGKIYIELEKKYCPVCGRKLKQEV